MKSETFKQLGTLNIVLRGPDGVIKDTREIHNLVVSTGLAFIASRMKDATATAMSHMSLGTSSTATAGAQTTLIAQHADGRRALDSTTLVTTNVANDSIQYVATFPAGASTGAITEAGIFNNVTVGSMLCRTVFAVINKGALDSMIVTWKVISVGT